MSTDVQVEVWIDRPRDAVARYWYQTCGRVRDVDIGQLLEGAGLRAAS